MVSHKNGPLKQSNKKHKAEKKRNPVSQEKSSHCGKNVKADGKRARRNAAKQKRIQKALELKKCMELQGDGDHPIMCVLIPLTPQIPINLAQLLLENCDAKAEHCDWSVKPSLQDISYINQKTVGKHFSFVCANHDDLFGCLDLAQLADWVILVAPSMPSEMSNSTYSLLTALYAQGLTNTSIVVLSSHCDFKDLKQSIETRFALPESTIYPLNTKHQAISLLRHIASSQARSGAGRLKEAKAAGTTAVAQSAARYRSSMLVESIQVITPEDNTSSNKTAKLCLRGRLRGAPLFLHNSLEPNVGPAVHLTGWGDFPISEAKWTLANQTSHNWSVSEVPTSQTTGLLFEPEKMEDDSGDDDTSDDCSDSDESDVPMDNKDDEDSHSNDNTDEFDRNEDDDLDDTHSLASYAARTMCSTASSAFSSAQLAKFRAARSEEMFPDEVETPVNIPARERFAKYRALPKFQGTKWPVEKDELPTQYSDIATFQNYHRNRRTMIRYVRTLLSQYQNKAPCSIRCITPGANLELIFDSLPLDVAKSIASYHGSLELESTNQKPKNLHPLVVWSLLPHEHRMSVCHFTMRRVATALQATTSMVALANAANQIAENAEKNRANENLEFGEEASTQMEKDNEFLMDALKRSRTGKVGMNSQSEGPDETPIPPEAEPIQSKELMLFQAGIRRFLAAPIYSSIINSPHEKAKFERFFANTQSATVATVYAPVMYAPLNVLQFRIRVLEDDDGNISKPYIAELVATGSLNSVDPSRIIVKRIFLSGHPFKVRQRGAVVRFMFFNPPDIMYFKSVQLQTKNGAVGHIKEPVGTHGHMKCVFDRPLSQADVVLMPLYKRVFPKWVYESTVTKIFDESTGDDDKWKSFMPKNNDSEWIQMPETLQLSRKSKRANGEGNDSMDHDDIDNQAMALFA